MAPTRQRKTGLDLLEEFQSQLAQGTERARVDENLLAVSDCLRHVFAAGHVSVWIPNTDKSVLNPVCSNCDPEVRKNLPQSLPIGTQEQPASRCGRAFLSRVPQYYARLDESPPSCQSEMFERLGLRRMWVVPIPAPTLGFGDQGIIAVATIHFADEDDIDDLSDKVMIAVGRAVGHVIEVTLWREQDQLVKAAATTMAEFSGDRYDPFDRLAEAIATATNFEACTILLADDEHERLKIIGTTGVDDKVERVFGVRTYEYGQRATGRIAIDHNIIATENIDELIRDSDSRFPDRVDTPDMRQFIGAPIQRAAFVGVVRLRNKKAPKGHDWPRHLNALDLVRVRRVSTILAPLLSIVIEESRQDTMIERLKHDLDMPATMIRDYANYFASLPDARLRVMTSDLRIKMQDMESMAEIILVNGELLHLSRGEEIKLEPALTKITTASVVKLCKMLTSTARRKNILRVSYGGGVWFDRIPQVYVDQRLFNIALYNLIQNAIKYSHSGTEVEVDGGAVEVDGRRYYEIRVRNFGIGISDAAERKLFSRYYRSPEAKIKTANGVGIGLHTARKLIRLHGGDVLLTRRNNPTEFTIRLPASLSSVPPSVQADKPTGELTWPSEL